MSLEQLTAAAKALSERQGVDSVDRWLDALDTLDAAICGLTLGTGIDLDDDRLGVLARYGADKVTTAGALLGDLLLAE